MLHPRRESAVPPYSASKTGLNAFTVHMQVAENNCVAAALSEGDVSAGAGAKPRIRFYACAPELLKTVFSNYWGSGKAPEEGAEVVVRLVVDEEGRYERGPYWEVVGGEMRVVPW